ncbi:MAG: NAD-dependent epimerase/dehydratase family protein, partial [Thermoplasmata archaeon]|nr:NAD-dependent epimerase/dehydratase family protein [Thermoplasmata archaeon]
IYKGDVTDRGSMRAPMEGADGLFHLAAWFKVGVWDRRPAEAVNVQGTRNVLELMEELEIPRGVYTSSLAAFGDTRGQVVDESYRPSGPFPSTYDRTKWMAHFQVAEPMMKEGLPLIIVQPGIVYGPGLTGPLRDPVVDYLRGDLRFLPERNAYDWGHVDDTMRGHLAAMERGRTGEDYIISGPHHTLVEAFQIAEELTGIPAPTRRVSPGTLRFVAGLSSVFGRLFRASWRYHPETLRSALATYQGTSAKARKELGFEARPLREGLGEWLAYEMRLLGMTYPGT